MKIEITWEMKDGQAYSLSAFFVDADGKRGDGNEVVANSSAGLDLFLCQVKRMFYRAFESERVIAEQRARSKGMEGHQLDLGDGGPSEPFKYPKDLNFAE